MQNVAKSVPYRLLTVETRDAAGTDPIVLYHMKEKKRNRKPVPLFPYGHESLSFPLPFTSIAAARLRLLLTYPDCSCCTVRFSLQAFREAAQPSLRSLHPVNNILSYPPQPAAPSAGGRETRQIQVQHRSFYP